MFRSVVAGGLEMIVALAAFAALTDNLFTFQRGEIGDDRSGIEFLDDRS